MGDMPKEIWGLWVEEDGAVRANSTGAKKHPNQELTEYIRADQQIPEGYALVPIEPTQEILDAMDEQYMPFGEMAAAYNALIAAILTPPEKDD